MPGPRNRPPRRPLQRRRDPLRAPHRRAALHRIGGDDRLPDLQRGAAPADAGCGTGAAARDRQARHDRPGEITGRTLSERPGVPVRPARRGRRDARREHRGARRHAAQRRHREPRFAAGGDVERRDARHGGARADALRGPGREDPGAQRGHAGARRDGAVRATRHEHRQQRRAPALPRHGAGQRRRGTRDRDRVEGNERRPSPAVDPRGTGGTAARPPLSTQPLEAPFINQTTQRLAVYLGPIAKVVARKAADQACTRDEFLQIVAGHIGTQDRRSFLREMDSSSE